RVREVVNPAADEAVQPHRLVLDGQPGLPRLQRRPVDVGHASLREATAPCSRPADIAASTLMTASDPAERAPSARAAAVASTRSANAVRWGSLTAGTPIGVAGGSSETAASCSPSTARSPATSDRS